MVRERAAGRTRLLGVSNVSLRHLEQMTAFGSEAPASFRTAASRATAGDVRAFCSQRKLVYQAFSLLTANPEVLRHPVLARISMRRKTTPA